MANQYRDRIALGTIQSIQIPVNMAPVITEVYKGAAPLVELLLKLNKKTVDNPKYEHLKRTRHLFHTTANSVGGFASNASTIVVADGTFLLKGDMVRNLTTGEQMRVNTDPSSPYTSVAVTRKADGGTAYAITHGDVLEKIGTSFEDGSLAPKSVNLSPTGVYNYIQCFRTAVEADWTSQATKLYGGSEWDFQRSIALKKHKEEMERAMFWSNRSTSGSGTDIRRTTGGLNYWISSNVLDGSTFGGALTQKRFEGLIEDACVYDESDFMMFCDNVIIKAIRDWYDARLTYTSETDKFGYQIGTYQSWHGPKIEIHRYSPFNLTHSGTAFLLRPNRLGMAVLKGRDTTLEPDLADIGRHHDKEGYYTYCGLMVEAEEHHAKITGVTS